jgi:hypothetical protein
MEYTNFSSFRRLGSARLGGILFFFISDYFTTVLTSSLGPTTTCMHEINDNTFPPPFSITATMKLKLVPLPALAFY